MRVENNEKQCTPPLTASPPNQTDSTCVKLYPLQPNNAASSITPLHRRRTLVATTTNSGKQKDTHINVLAHHSTMKAKTPTVITLLLYVHTGNPIQPPRAQLPDRAN